ARCNARGECSRLAPVTAICTAPASRARAGTASRSRSKESWVRLAPISISCMVIAGEKCRCIVPAPPGRPYPRPMNDPQFPISPLLPQVRDTLAAHPRLVLEAPPGAGKTTQAPLALLDAPWLQGRRIILLEPRRVAARSAAQFMARQVGEDVGDTVGYRIRFENRISARTRIEVVTEGILTRMLQDDPMLESVGAILFDEFHERHLSGDLGLALALDVQSQLREDLRLVVMSATLDGERLARLLD